MGFERTLKINFTAGYNRDLMIWLPKVYQREEELQNRCLITSDNKSGLGTHANAGGPLRPSPYERLLR